MAYELNGAVIEHDDEGYLTDVGVWNRQLAELIARAENIEMNADAWEVVNFLRSYYEEYQIAPAVRVLTKAIKKKLGDQWRPSLVRRRTRRRSRRPGSASGRTRFVCTMTDESN